jgi:NAD(P)H-flavin reductase
VVKLQFGPREVDCAPDQTVLDALLDSGEDVPYSCKTGMCLTCMMQCKGGTVPEASQNGIKGTLVEQGYFLPCVCTPTDDLDLSPADDHDLFTWSVVHEIEPLNETVCRVLLDPTTPIYYRAGQFINVRRADGLVRSYSLASVPQLDGFLELHVKRLPRGRMSNWMFDELKKGDRLEIQGPNGSCYYTPGKFEQNMLLVGNGSGLAPLFGIARDALASGHKGKICLYHGSQSRKGHYLVDVLRDLDAEHANFTYFPCASREEPADNLRSGRAEIVAARDLPDIKGWSVFLCGFPPMVTSARKWAYLAGAAMNDIYADPFDLKDLRAEPRD